MYHLKSLGNERSTLLYTYCDFIGRNIAFLSSKRQTLPMDICSIEVVKLKVRSFERRKGECDQLLKIYISNFQLLHWARNNWEEEGEGGRKRWDERMGHLSDEMRIFIVDYADKRANGPKKYFRKSLPSNITKAEHTEGFVIVGYLIYVCNNFNIPFGVINNRY